MDNDKYIGIIWFFLGALIFLIIIKIISYFLEYSKDIKHTKMEMHIASNEKEYKYWRRKLRILHLCIIPGLNPYRIKVILNFFKSGKHNKKKETDNIVSLLMPSLIGIIICAACLAGGTFAWFTASQSTATQNITAANYTINTTVKIQNSEDIIAPQGSVYNLEKNTYQVELDASGSTATTGYCILELGETKVITQQFPTQDRADNKSITFTLEINEAVDMKVVAQWGTSASRENKLQNGGTYTYGDAVSSITVNSEEKSEQIASTEQITENTDIYTVVSGDSLTSIAAKYNTSIEKLVVYNKLANTDIQIGQKIKIPPEDYEIPKPEATGTAVQESEQVPTESAADDAEKTNNTAESSGTDSQTSN